MEHLADPASLVARLGGHPAARLGLALDPADDDSLWRWWLAACLLSDRLDEAGVAAVLSQLAPMGCGNAADLAKAEPEAIASALAGAGHRRAEPRAAQLVGAARALVARWDGSLSRVAAQSDGPDELGAALVGLAPGIGSGSVRRYLAALRVHWAAAAELPLSRAAAAAAHHLGWLGEADDDAGVLLRQTEADPADLEAALERLGARACLRGAPARCPLGASCPLRRASA